MECPNNLKRSEILVSAAKLFAEKGFARTKVDEIAALANVGKGTIYCYFENKEQIFQAMVVEGMAEMYRQTNLTISGYGDYGQKFKLIIEKYLQYIAQNKEFFKASLNEQANGRSLNGRKANRQINEAYHRFYRLLEDYIDDGILQGFFRPGNSRHYVLALTGMMNSIAWDLIMSRDRKIRPDDVEIILDIFLTGVKNPVLDPT